MNSVQRERAQMILRNWSDVEAVEDAKALLQELIDAPETEPFAVIHLDGSFVHVEFKQPIAGTGKFEVYAPPSVPEVDPVAKVTGYYGGYLSISTIDGRVLPAGTALFTAPPAPSVPDGWKLVPYTPTDEMLEQAAYAVNSRPTPSKYEATATPAIIFWNAMLKYSPESTCIKEPPADLVRDAERYRWLTADHASAETRSDVNNIASSIRVRSYAATSAANDAAIEREIL